MTSAAPNDDDVARTNRRRQLQQELSITRTLRDQAAGDDRALFDDRATELEKQIANLESAAPASAYSATSEDAVGRGPVLEGLVARLERLRADLVEIEKADPRGEGVIGARERTMAEIAEIEAQLAVLQGDGIDDQGVPDPIRAARGRGILVEPLFEFTWPGTTTHYLSRALRVTLEMTIDQASSGAAGDAVKVFTAHDLMRNLMAVVAVRGVTGDPRFSWIDPLLGMLTDRWREPRSPVSAKRVADAVLAPSAVALLAEAARIRAAMDAGQKSIGRRHLFCAAFLSDAGLRALDVMTACSQTASSRCARRDGRRVPGATRRVRARTRRGRRSRRGSARRFLPPDTSARAAAAHQ
jgi:hypothetical protein